VSYPCNNLTDKFYRDKISAVSIGTPYPENPVRQNPVLLQTNPSTSLRRNFNSYVRFTSYPLVKLVYSRSTKNKKDTLTKRLMTA
jgi:hypothetical protein